jgi:hypothetical protein
MLIFLALPNINYYTAHNRPVICNIVAVGYSPLQSGRIIVLDPFLLGFADPEPLKNVKNV